MQVAESVIDRALKHLPPELRAEASRVPVVLLDLPDDSILEEGFEPDLLGLFVGSMLPDDEGASEAPVPPQIFLFLDNLWEFSDADPAVFRREVRKTFLHELGHRIGLDEHDLEVRGMD